MQVFVEMGSPLLYNNNQTTQKNKEMQEENSILREVPDLLSQEQIKIVSEEEVFQEIDQYLNESAFVDPEIPITSAENLKNEKLSEKSEPLREESPNQKPSREVSTNSLFHNFQKHLIIIVKKVANITKESLEGYSGGDLAFLLWIAFVKTKSHSKKMFHIIFGVPKLAKAPQELDRLARSFEEFRKVKESYDLDSIVRSQELLRSIVGGRIQTCPKSEIVQKTNVHKIDEFYQYIKSFAYQLMEGPAAYRMTKIRKTKVFKELKNQRRTS